MDVGWSSITVGGLKIMSPSVDVSTRRGENRRGEKDGIQAELAFGDLPIVDYDS